MISLDSLKTSRVKKFLRKLLSPRVYHGLCVTVFCVTKTPCTPRVHGNYLEPRLRPRWWKYCLRTVLRWDSVMRLTVIDRRYKIHFGRK